MSERELAIKIENLKKEYRLGQIGGGTLRGDLQSWWARKRGKEDPNTKIGTKIYDGNETFMALNGIDLEVYKGERLGIIGGNGAGKSTTLKILSRVTAPTEGNVYINGRISSMLEVGTGFHPELTGRENIYLNGAILGMSKAEVDAKIEDIIDFSECRQFIDTPVKRYSSGMYVKLAFAVAAHLDSEILVMDEVLAVGDMKFQQKCLKKMNDLAESEGRTVLYVSHNMNTIRQLCDRCIVLKQGKVIFSGNVEEAISIYLGTENNLNSNIINVVPEMREALYINPLVEIKKVEILNDNNSFTIGHKMNFSIILCNKSIEDKEVNLRIMIKTINGSPVTMTMLKNNLTIEKNNVLNKIYQLDISHLVPGKYTLSFVIFEVDDSGSNINIEVLRDIYLFNIKGEIDFNHNMHWNTQWWGNVYIENLIEL